MADQIPIKKHTPEPGLAEFQQGDTIGIAHGGTGASDSATALDNLGAASATALDSHINNAQKHVTISVINGDFMPTFYDPLRLKHLSFSMNSFTWAEAKVNNNEWFQVAHAIDKDSCYVMPYDGVIVGFTVHCEDTGGNTKPLRLYINNVQNSVIGVISGTTNVILSDNGLNINFQKNDRLRIRGGIGGVVQDTVVTLFVRWRA